MERDIKTIIRQDTEAGYKKVVLTNKGCSSCVYASKNQDNSNTDTYFAYSHLFGADSHGKDEKFCSEQGQWMRKEYWIEKRDCPLWQANGFTKTRRVVLRLRPIWE